MSKQQKRSKLKRPTAGDYAILLFLLVLGLIMVLPFYNVIVISFTTEKEYLTTPFVLFPQNPTLANYKELFRDGRILSGYKTTFQILLMALPLNLFLTTSFAYGMSRKNYPGRRLIFFFVLITMVFNGGIIPLYLQMKELHLTNTLWSVVLANSINTFYMIIMRNFFSSLPESLVESARLDGAGEWGILFRIILPLSAPIIATVVLFYTVDRWNEWYNAMIFIQNAKLRPLQLILRSIVMNSQVEKFGTDSGTIALNENNFTMGLKTAAIVCTMAPVMMIFPFLQRYFVKGVIVGAVKA